MLRAQVLIAAIVALMINVGHAGGQTTQPAQAPTTKAASISPEELNKLASLRELPRRPTSRDDAIKLFRQTRKEVFAYGEQLIAGYPHADNLHVVYLDLIGDASILHRTLGDRQAGEKLQKWSRGLLALKTAPPEAKAEADFILTGMQIRPPGVRPIENAVAIIGSYLKRHEKTAPAVSTVLGVSLAKMAGSYTMRDSLIETLQKKHIRNERVSDFLIGIGKYTGPFLAKPTKLDGKKLNLPDDLLGKVVVIDFWASWCGPCLAELPNMRRIHKAYKSKGVVFVGISLDRSRGELDSFLKTNNLPWIQTYDGRDNPTARKYRIEGIPSIWVIGKDGNVASMNARGRLEKTIEQALVAPASTGQPLSNDP